MAKALKYVVLSPLSHDQKDYQVGQTIELPTEEAKLLLDQGIIEPAGKAQTDQTEPAVKAQAEKADQAGK